MTIQASSPTISLPGKLSHLWQGALWKILSCAAFAGINGLVRYLSGGSESSIESPLPTHVIMFFQNVFGSLFLLPLIYKLGIKRLSTRYPMAHCLRVGFAVLGVSLWYLTLKFAPIAESVALTFTGPIFTVVGAHFFLKESLGNYRILAIIICFIGAFIISRPDLALLGSHETLGFIALLPLGSAIALACNKLMTRQLARQGETAETLTAYLLFLMVPVSFALALFEWVTPNVTHWPWLLLLGLLAAIAHLSFGLAYKCAEVTFLTPFGFSKFLFSTAVGFIFFMEVPKNTLWIGISVIGVSIFILSYKMPLYSIARRFKSSWFKNNE